MRPAVSIIVPIYNMEPYLTRCLDSLISQSLSAIEIIAINDGSSDNTLSILQHYALNDPRIHLINKRNAGVSAARNDGLMVARGEFIGFVDPDDWVNPHMFETLYEAAKQEQVDVVMCSYIREFGTHAKEKLFQEPEVVKYEGEQVHTHILRRLIGPIESETSNPENLDAWGTVWSKLYRAELLQNNNVHFIDLEIIGTNEDCLFNIHALYYASSFLFVNEPLYHYWRDNSQSITASYKPLLLKRFMKQYELMEQFIDTHQLNDKHYTALRNRIGMNILGLGLNTVQKSNRSTMLQKIQAIDRMLNDKRIKQSLQQLKLEHCPMVWKVFFSCAKLRFSTGLYLLLQAINYLRTRKS